MQVRVAVALSVCVTSLAGRQQLSDWPFFLSMSKQMFGPDGFTVFARSPNIQSGPLSLFAVRVLSLGPLDTYVARCLVFGGLAIVTLECFLAIRRDNRAAAPPSLDVKLIVGGVVVIGWWSYLQKFGHLDDALVLTGFSVALLMLTRNHRYGAAVVLGLLLAVKPWSVLLLPMTIERGVSRRAAIRPPLVSLAVGGLIWLPFVLASPGTLDGVRPAVTLAHDSVLRLFGVDASTFPPALRVVQLCGAVCVAALAVVNRRPSAVLLGGVAVRIATDPATWSYYSTGLVVGALAWDLCVSARRLPIMTLLSAILLAPAWIVPDPDVRALMRLVVCVAAVSIVVWPPGGRSRAPLPVVDRAGSTIALSDVC